MPPDPVSAPSSVVIDANAGPTKDPWVEISRLTYGGDRSYAWTVREQVILSAPENRLKIEERLLAALNRPDCTDAGCAALCELLAWVGTAKSVPALAGLLKVPAKLESARYALEPIPGPEASAALREALASMRGVSKIGLIGSIAHRRDPLAVPALTALRDASAEPADVREAASRALEKIART